MRKGTTAATGTLLDNLEGKGLVERRVMSYLTSTLKAVVTMAKSRNVAPPMTPISATLPLRDPAPEAVIHDDVEE